MTAGSDRVSIDSSAEADGLSEALLGSLGEAVVVVRSRDGRIVLANAATGELFRIAPSELAGKDARLLHRSDEEHALHEARTRQALSEGRPYRGDVRLRRFDGEVFDAEVTTSALDPDDPDGGVVSVLRDVSGARRAEARIGRERDRFPTLFRTGPVAMALTDAGSSSFVEVNDRWCEITGFRREEMIGRSSLELGLWEDPQERDRVAGLLESDGLVDNFRVRLRRRDGALRDVFGSVQRIELDDRPLWFSTLHDVTEQVRLDQERARMRERRDALERLEAIGELAGGVAHDMNNLLLPILVNAELALSGASDELRAQMEEVREAALRGRELTKKLLAFGRKQTLRKKPLDLSEVVRSTEPILRRLVPENIEIELELDLASDLPAVHADAGQMELALINLVGNARDAVPGSGRIRISTGLRRPRAGRRYGVSPVEGPHAYLEVSDTGSGIPEEIADKIFEPFFTTKHEAAGTGLGLSSVLGIVEQHSGHIELETELDGGTTFSVGLPPMSKVDASARDREPIGVDASARNTGEGKTALIVEDDAAVRRVTARVLRRYGYSVIEAEDGRRAIGVVESRLDDIDIIISDMVMPGMTGLELRREIEGLAPDLPVLLVSGYSASVLAEHGIDEGSVDVLEKPFTPEGLVRSVADVIAGRGNA